MNKGNLVLSSNDAEMWFDGEPVWELSKASAKTTKENDDITFVGDKTTYKKGKGYKVEGSFTVKKINSRITRKVANSIKTGIDLDTKIIAKMARTDGKTERVALTGVDISELNLFDLEAQGNMEQEFPFTANDFDYLDFIE